MQIDTANDDDLPAIVAIYNHYIEHSFATFDTKPFTVTDRVAWFAAFDRPIRQCLVARRDGAVVGYACSTAFKPKPAWDSTAEVSVYVGPRQTGSGVGAALYSKLLPRLDAAGLHRAAAVIALPNEPSIALHERFGFEAMGTISEGGYKFGAYHDVAYLIRHAADARPR